MTALRCALLAAIASLAIAGGALGATGSGAEAAEGQAAGERLEVFEQAMDRHGRPIGPKVAVDPRGHRPDAAAQAAAAGPRPAGTGRGVRLLQASGCKTVTVSRIRTGYFGETLWRYTQEKYFCWSSPRLTNVQTQAYACCVDPFWRYVGTIGSSGWFFSWSGDSRGGHYSFRQGRFDQTVLGQVTSSAYPWIKIWAYGNGSWSYQTDVS